MARARGVALLGPPPASLIGEVPHETFLDAVMDDARWIMKGGIVESPFYGVLNLCRVLQLRLDEPELPPSKEEGAMWARVLPIRRAGGCQPPTHPRPSVGRGTTARLRRLRRVSSPPSALSRGRPHLAWLLADAGRSRAGCAAASHDSSGSASRNRTRAPNAAVLSQRGRPYRRISSGHSVRRRARPERRFGRGCGAWAVGSTDSRTPDTGGVKP